MNKLFSRLILILAMPAILLAADNDRERGMSERANPFGVLEFLHWDHDWNNHKYGSTDDYRKVMRLLKDAGVGMVRIDFLWSDIEPSPGQFHFDKYDLLVGMLNKEGIGILGIFNYSVEWASSCGKWNCPLRDNSLFVNYASEVIRRYKNNVKYWEVWNEPDSPDYWQPQDGLKTYCLLLKDVYLAAKKIDPDCKILNGGIANGLGSVHRLYDNGAKDYFDILNLHFFVSPLQEGAAKAVEAYPKLAYKVMCRNGDGHKKIWITEIGSPGVRTGENVDNWWLGANPDEKIQARWVKEVYSQLLADPNVERVFWAFFRDCHQHWKNGVDHFGLVRWDFSKKPSFMAYKRAAQEYNRGRKK